MNWYKLAQEWESYGSLKDDLDEVQNKQELMLALQANNVQVIEEIDFPEAKEKILIVNDGGQEYIITVSFPYPSISEPTEWIWNIANFGNAWQYVGEIDYHKEFWSGIDQNTIYYHGTNRERAQNIMKPGGSLESRDEIRGMGNKSTGPAVFLSKDLETATYSYDVVFAVNVGQMKADGYMPRAGVEDPVEEYDALDVLASKIGLEDFHQDLEEGIDPNTIILYGEIPNKYLQEV